MTSLSFICLIVLFGTTKPDDDIIEEVDKAMEDDITSKLIEDLIESIERKFQDDLSKSVNMLLVKVKTMLQNGTNHIYDGLQTLRTDMETMQGDTNIELQPCIANFNKDSQTIAENALHQMIMCAYALIGQDPTQSVLKVVQIKQMITEDIKPIRRQKSELNGLMKICGHNHGSLKKVIKCVISKSPLIKSIMMETTQKLISGVVELTKLIAHGAMHEACLIEVIKSVEDEAIETIKNAKLCYKKNNGNDE